IVGTLRMQSTYKGTVTTDADTSLHMTVKVYGSLNLNRCFDGDYVVVEFLDYTDLADPNVNLAVWHESITDAVEVDDELNTVELLANSDRAARQDIDRQIKAFHDQISGTETRH